MCQKSSRVRCVRNPEGGGGVQQSSRVRCVRNPEGWGVLKIQRDGVCQIQMRGS